jgi:uncharacterized protein YndB with AHSA1/START domain
MGHITRSIRITRPPAEVFAMLIDVDRLPEWATTVIETRDLSHPSLQVGCTFRQAFKLMGRQLDSEWRVTEFDALRRIAYAATSPEGGRLQMSQTVEAVGEDSEVTFDIDYELPGGFIGRLVDRAGAERRVEDETVRSLGNLKRVLEGDTDESEAASHDA